MTFLCGSRYADQYLCLAALDPDPAPDPALFFSDLQDAKNLSFFLITFFEGTFSSFFKDTTHNRSHKTVEIKVFLTIFA